MYEIDPKQFDYSAYEFFAKDWALVTAGTKESGWNTMTVSWGHLGSLWGHGGGLPTAIVYIRPQRYTKRFMDTNPYFTLTIFDAQYKKDLAYLGSHSGKDEDKVAKTNLHPIAIDHGIAFEEAKITLLCRTLYQAPVEEKYFKDQVLMKTIYPEKDFHDMYIAQIEKVWIK